MAENHLSMEAGRPETSWIREAAGYGVAGGIGTVSHYALLILLATGFRFPEIPASALGASLGAVVNFFLNHHVVFRSRAPYQRTLSRFLAVALIGIGVNTGVFAAVMLTGWFHYLAAQVAATACVFATGYSFNKHWTFPA